MKEESEERGEEKKGEGRWVQVKVERERGRGRDSPICSAGKAVTQLIKEFQDVFVSE